MTMIVETSAIGELAEKLRERLAEFSFAPFWFWNDELHKDELEAQLRAMNGQGVDQVIIHARLGLRTEYLSPAWFDCVGHCLKLAEAIGMKVWLYDELNWPSGCAAGRVLARYPAGRSRHLVMHPISGAELLKNPFAVVPEGELVAALLISPGGDRVLDVTAQVSNCQVMFDPPGPEWTAYFFLERLDARCHPLALPYQPDHLDPRVVQLFIEETHEQYYRRFAPHFGKTLLGFFTDEPGLYYNLWNQQPGSLPWTPGFFAYFEQLNGYDLKPRLPWLWLEGPLTARTRQDFWHAVATRFTDVFLRQQRQWCEGHGVQLIGHLECEENLCSHIQFLGDFFAPMRQLHMAGLDRIDMNFSKLTEKLASSVQHVTPGLARTMSESFALTGWDATLQTLRRIVDWQYARGTNLIVPHAFFYSIRDARQNECPPSLFIQNTFWPYFSLLSNYVKRLGYLLTRGRFEAPFALYYPLQAARRRYDPGRMPPKAEYAWKIELPKGHSSEELDGLLLDVIRVIEQNQSDFDFVDDAALAQAQYDAGAIQVCEQAYRALIVVDWGNMDPASRERAARWARAGGLLLTLQLSDSPPMPVESLGPNHHACASAAELEEVIEACGLRNVELLAREPAIRVMTRQWDEARLTLLCNESPERREIGLKVSEGEQAIVVDCQGGELRALRVQEHDGQDVVRLTLEGYESQVLLLTREELDPPLPLLEIPRRLLAELEGPWEIELAGETRPSPLRSWSELGQPRLSGAAVYRKTFIIEPGWTEGKLWLDLGVVHEIAEIEIDGRAVGVVCWAPWRIELPPLSPGQHRLRIKVTNTPINALEGKARVSGLLGPVRLLGNE